MTTQRRPQGQNIVVYWWDEGDGNEVLILWNGHERHFESTNDAMAFLKTLPIDSFLKPAGRSIDGMVGLHPDPGEGREAILASAEKLLNSAPAVVGAEYLWLHAHVSEDVMRPLFDRK